MDSIEIGLWVTGGMLVMVGLGMRPRHFRSGGE